MIPGICPDCGTARPLTDYLSDAEARAALAAELGLEKGQYNLRGNEGGIAVSGEVTATRTYPFSSPS